MTIEKVKELLPIIQAYAEGKEIQFYNGYEWKDCPDPLFYYDTPYRIKPEPKIRPYTFEELCEAVKKHGGYVISKDRTVLNHINVADVRGVFENYHTDSIYKYDELLKNFVWLDDNTPCGVMEE